jgi:hypothetical protein
MSTARAALRRLEPPTAQPATSGAPRAPSNTVAETLKTFVSSSDAGLAKIAAAARLAKQRPNEVAEKRNHPLLRFARKFWGLSVWTIELI